MSERPGVLVRVPGLPRNADDEIEVSLSVSWPTTATQYEIDAAIDAAAAAARASIERRKYARA
jgi:hypothetical protein